MSDPASAAASISSGDKPRRHDLLRLGVSAALLVACFWLVDTDLLWATLRRFDFALFVAAAGFYLASQAAVAGRFQVTLAALRRPITLGESLRYHLVSQWFNQLLPTSFGGEIVKILMLRQRVGVRRAVRAVVLNRVLGLASLLLAALLFTFLAWTAGLLDGAVAAGTALVLGGATLPLLPAALPRLVRRLTRPLMSVPVLSKLVTLGLVFARDLRRMAAPALWRPILLYSVAVLALTLATILVLATGAGLGGNLGAVLWAAPLMILAMHLPISFGGWGTREVGAMAAFEMLGLPAEAGLAVSLAYGATNLAGSAAGVVLVLVAQRFGPRVETRSPTSRRQTTNSPGAETSTGS